MTKKRVVVTGLGLVTPLGIDTGSTWEAILAGKSAITEVTHFDASEFNTRIAGHVKDFDPSHVLDSKEVRKLDKFVQFGMVAAYEALNDAGILSYNDLDPARIGAALGSGIGGLPMIEANHIALLEKGPRRISPYFIPGAIINMLPGYLSIKYGFQGPNISIVTACTTGTHNIGHAARAIAYGDADVMVAGGAEMATSALGLGGFSACKALSTRNDEPEKASRPWDKGRDGFVLADGAGMMILEEYEHAKSRGANIYAELVGFGMSSDGYHMTAPDPDGKGFCAVMRNALNDAGVSADQIDYVNAHGTSTPTGDMIELNAIQNIFGSHSANVLVSSTKSMLGHSLGATGAVEAAFSVLALRDQVAPPTINLDDPEEGIVVDLVPHTAREASLDYVLSNSFGFGGTNGSLLFKKIS